MRLRTRVDRLSAHGDGYLATCGDDTILADNVVVATGTFGRTPSIPDFADELDPMIMQLHSSEYRRPAQLRDGPVLVVGRLPLGHGHRLRARLGSPDDPVRP